MRDYSKVSGEFWTGKTGKSLRGDMQTQIIAMYLMTSRHSNMIGVFHCPILYMAHETGSPIEGATKSLNKLIEGGFCTYDEDSETVWVHEMARFQIDDTLKSGDKRVSGIQKQFDSLPESLIKQGFYEKYATSFHIKKDQENKPLTSPSEAPTKPEAVAGTETEAETGSGAEDSLSPEGEKKSLTTCSAVTKALRKAGLGSASTTPSLQVLLDAGATVDVFVNAYQSVRSTPSKATMPYVLRIVQTQMEAAAQLKNTNLAPLSKLNRQEALEAKNQAIVDEMMGTGT